MATLTLTAYQDSAKTMQVTDGVRLHTTDYVYIVATFSKGVTFSASDISTTRSGVSEFVSTSASLYEFKLTASSVVSRLECSMFVDMSQIVDVDGNAGTGFVDFTFVHDSEAQSLAITTASGTEMGVVRIPEGYSITPTTFHKEVTNIHVSTRPTGYTPWTHRNLYTIDPIDSTNVVYLIETGSRSSDDRKKLVKGEALRRLEETDWMLLSDETQDAGFPTYRSALRTIINSFNTSGTAPSTVSFPEVPVAGTSGATTNPYPGTISTYTRT